MSEDQTNIGEYYLPGDVIENVKSLNSVTVLGPGLRQNKEKPNTICVTRPGKLHFKAPNTYWIEGLRKRYVPKTGDLVVGIIVKKSGDTVRVDIGSAEFAILSLLAFEGATKKQKPDVQVGDTVYAKLLNAYREMEPELVCIDSYYKAGTLGVLSSNGFITNISLDLAYNLLDVEFPLLRTLGKKFPYEIAIGVNGKVWINCRDSKNVLKIVKAFDIAEKKLYKDVVDVCRQIK